MENTNSQFIGESDLIAERVFALKDQRAFATFSGDFNPIHIDPESARRSLAGAVVVHGIHSLLWALDVASVSAPEVACFEKLQVQFEQPILLGEQICCVRQVEEGAAFRFDLMRNGRAAVKIEITPGAARGSIEIPPARFEPAEPSVRAIEDMEGRSGGWPLAMDGEQAACLFPNLVSHIDPGVLASLVQTSRLVGMECPGLHSLYSELHLSRIEEQTARLDYHVSQVEQRFSFITIDLKSGGLGGKVRAFVRPQSSKQPGMAEISREVSPGDYTGQRALIVGGSRGLGELTAKALAAGGADICLTFHCGEKDATRVLGEIEDYGGAGRILHYDVLSGDEPMLPQDWLPTHLYYFATPFISAGTSSGWDGSLMDKFVSYYVTGFARLIENLAPLGVKHALFPSTIYLEEIPSDMAEYCAAKAEGENLCELLRRRHRGLKIHAPRLPRMSTDQTVSLLPVFSLDPLPVMLEHIRSLAGLPSDTSGPTLSKSTRV